MGVAFRLAPPSAGLLVQILHIHFWCMALFFSSSWLRRFCVLVNSGAESHSPNTFWPKVEKLCWSWAIRFDVVEKDIWHCPGYLAGTYLCQFSRRARSKVCQKVGARTIRRGLATPSESAFLGTGGGHRSRGALFFRWSGNDFLVCELFLSCI